MCQKAAPTHLSPQREIWHALQERIGNPSLEKRCLVFLQHTLLVVLVKAVIQIHNEYHKEYTRQSQVPVQHRLKVCRLSVQLTT